ncbi:MAG: DUF47 family protein [Ruminococcaceae bacterium]|nr:DUF47 family protein [Oscillospiraceae bacterium]
MANNRDMFYYDAFVKQSEYSCRAAQLLQEVFESYDEKTLSVRIEQMHKIEHDADVSKHELMDKLAHEFLPPLDREDINLLANEIDNVTDTIEDVLRCFYMYNIVDIYPSAVEFSKLIVKCCDMLLQTMKEFRNFKKSKLLNGLIIEINRLEEEGDRLYTAYIRQLFTEKSDPYSVMAWKEAYKYLELSCDTCEHVADIIESVIMKNS